MVKQKGVKDVVEQPVETDFSQYVTKLDKPLPKTRERKDTIKALEMMEYIATLEKGIYKVNLEKLFGLERYNKLNNPVKSAYPLLERYMQLYASKKGYDVSKREKVGKRVIIPGYAKFKKECMKLRLSSQGEDRGLYIEKV